MTEIQKNLNTIKATIPEKVTLVAVSKTKPVSDIMQAYEAGQRVFGENKIQEMVAKWETMPKDISWHMIGHVQRNKVKYIAPFVDLIHAVDSYKLLKEIDNQAKKFDRTINCLLQIKIASEESKYGLSTEEALILLNSKEFKSITNVTIQGLMGMATFTDDQEQIKEEFEKISSFFERIQPDFPNLKKLSIGMSGDYPIAIDYNSTMVRIGSAIFGTRNYK